MAWVTFGTQVFCAQSNAAACGETLLGSWLHTRDGFIGVVFLGWWEFSHANDNGELVDI